MTTGLAIHMLIVLIMGILSVVVWIYPRAYLFRPGFKSLSSEIDPVAEREILINRFVYPIVFLIALVSLIWRFVS